TPSGARWAEAALVGVGLLVTGYLAFDTSSAYSGFSEPRFYAPVPLLFWAAIRFGMAGASGAIVLFAGLAVEAALEGRGPFTGQSAADTALALQHFLLLRAVPLYLIAILGEQRSAVEQSLRESQERTSLAATAAELGLWDWDIVRDQVWYTRTGRIDLGALAPISFGGFIRLIHPDDRREVGVALSRAMGGSGDFESTYRIVLADETTRWVASIGRVEFDASGRPTRLRGVSRDVTRSHQVEQQVHGSATSWPISRASPRSASCRARSRTSCASRSPPSSSTRGPPSGCSSRTAPGGARCAPSSTTSWPTISGPPRSSSGSSMCSIKARCAGSPPTSTSWCAESSLSPMASWCVQTWSSRRTSPPRCRPSAATTCSSSRCC
ncbi:MAG TPA: MASE1 domain-containing protein, partial [Methylomirabilota bacterium]|nr:MASE1 domain-containing protein [Methylomirabilota bacterium]